MVPKNGVVSQTNSVFQYLSFALWYLSLSKNLVSSSEHQPWIGCGSTCLSTGQRKCIALEKGLETEKCGVDAESPSIGRCRRWRCRCPLIRRSTSSFKNIANQLASLFRRIMNQSTSFQPFSKSQSSSASLSLLLRAGYPLPELLPTVEPPSPSCNCTDDDTLELMRYLCSIDTSHGNASVSYNIASSSLFLT